MLLLRAPLVLGMRSNSQCFTNNAKSFSNSAGNILGAPSLGLSNPSYFECTLLNEQTIINLILLTDKPCHLLSKISTKTPLCQGNQIIEA